MRSPEPKSHPEFTVDSSSRDLIRELFERVEDLTARLDCLSRPPVPEASDHEEAARQTGPRANHPPSPSRRHHAQDVNRTGLGRGPALDHPDRMPSSESEPRRPSPYLDAKGAAAYLGITLGSLYGIVERGSLVPLRGPKRRYRFTEAMLDEYLRRKGDGR